MPKTVETRKRHKWRGRTKLFALGALIFVSTLIYWEQVALLYVASTVLLCAVLLAVAFADLEGKDRKLAQATEGTGIPEVSGR
jgi:hypothetical protein